MSSRWEREGKSPVYLNRSDVDKWTRENLNKKIYVPPIYAIEKGNNRFKFKVVYDKLFIHKVESRIGEDITLFMDRMMNQSMKKGPLKHIRGIALVQRILRERLFPVLKLPMIMTIYREYKKEGNQVAEVLLSMNRNSMVQEPLVVIDSPPVLKKDVDV